MKFPNVEGENLDGVPLAFPRDFAGRTIVLVGFDLKQRTDLESWVPFVDRYVRAGTAGGRMFAVIASSMGAMTKMIVATMRKGAPSAESRAATVPLFLDDVEAFCAALGIADRSAIHAFVVGPDGSILEHQVGAFSDRAAAAFEAHVKVSA